jgi:hypothetical protein
MGHLVAALLTVFGATVSGPGESMAVAAAIAPKEAAAPAAARAEVRVRAIGGAGTLISQGAISSLDPNTALRGRLWYGAPGQIGQADRMMREAHSRQSVAYRTAPLCSATWRFRPATKSPRDIEAADYLGWSILERMPWELIVKRHVGGYTAKGFSLAEMTDDFVTLPRDRFPLHPGGGRGVAPTGIHEIPQSTVAKFNQSKTNPAQLASIEQYIGGSDGETAGNRTIPADRLLRWTLDQEGANFEGIALLRSAYAAHKMKVAFRTIAAMKHERRGVGTPVIVAGPDANDPELDAAVALLEEMRSNAKGSLVLKNGWAFSWEGGSQGDETDIEAAIAACDLEIAYNASAGFMLLGHSSMSGSYALGSTQQGQYHLAVAGDARFFALGWNLGFDGWSPAERIVKLNYGEDVGIPILEARNLPTSNWSERLPLLINAVIAGVVTVDDLLEEDVREALEFDPRDEATSRPRFGPQQPLMKTARDNPKPTPGDGGADPKPKTATDPAPEGDA